jgi:hypothetical protein
MSKNYNGAILFDNTLLTVYDKRTKGLVKKSVTELCTKNKKFRFKSYYKDSKSAFILKEDKISPFIYMISLVNNASFICGSGHKVMVYREGNNAPELLSIEYLSNTCYKNLYIPYIDYYLIKEKGFDIQHMKIASIIKQNNTLHTGYKIIFDENAYSTLLILGCGVLINGDKGEGVLEIANHAKSKNTVQEKYI